MNPAYMGRGGSSGGFSAAMIGPAGQAKTMLYTNGVGDRNANTSNGYLIRAPTDPSPNVLEAVGMSSAQWLNEARMNPGTTMELLKRVVPDLVRSWGVGTLFGMVSRYAAANPGFYPRSQLVVNSFNPMLRAAGRVNPGGQATPPAMLPGETPEQYSARLTASGVFNVVGQTLGIVGTTIAAAITSGNALAIAHLTADTQLALANLARQGGGSADQIAALTATITALQAAQAVHPVPEPAISPTMIIGGVAALALVGGAVYLASRPRKNPSCATCAPRSNPVVKRGGRKVFVPAAKLRRQRRKGR